MRFAVLLLHAGDDIRRDRLATRGQPELATDDMNSWARYLHEQTQQLGGHVIDASGPIDEVTVAVSTHALGLLSDVAAPEAPPPLRRN
jgi:hypothetical protein